jgi:glycosyltransferase involved in cell wall biosynthesis
VSASTRDDLRRFGHRAPIDVIPLGAGPSPSVSSPTKTLSGRLVAIGRLTPSKRFDQAITALALLRDTHPDARLDIVGTGPEHDRLAGMITGLGLTGHVTLHGRIDDAARDRLLADADAVVGTSVREGWGLTVTEAALVGTPAVVYDIPGFRDAVIDGRTGVVTSKTPAALAQGVRDLLADRPRYSRIAEAARRRARAFTWTATADAFEEALRAAVSQRS